MTKKNGLLERFHHSLVVEISTSCPEYLEATFTVAEIYQNLVPYRSHRDLIGVEMNGDYENALLRLLGGEGGFLVLESEPALREIQNELLSKNPNTGLFREFAAAGVRLNPERLEPDMMKASAEKGPDAGNGARGPNLADEEGPTPTASIPPSLSASPATPATPARKEGNEVTVLPFERPAASRPAGAGAGTGAGAGAGAGAADPEVSQCPQCREVLPDRAGLRFCPGCGTDVLVVACGDCGEELERHWRFCVACGLPAPR